MKQNPKWTTDETILCLDFYFRYRPSIPTQNSKELKGLYLLIKKFNVINGNSGASTFRNTNGVYMKIMNLMHLDPECDTGLPRNSKVDHRVWERFSSDKSELRKIAKNIEYFINIW